MTKKPWQEATNVKEVTERVVIYCHEDQKEEWAEKAREKGYRSRSTYLYELINEAQAYRSEGFLARKENKERVEELEAKVERLETQLEAQKQKERQQSGKLEIDDPEFLYRFLDTQYKSLEDILRSIVESGALNELIRKPVEDQLYFLASQDRVEYKTGYGWKLTENRGDT
jgi:hypothetical protein